MIRDGVTGANVMFQGTWVRLFWGYFVSSLGKPRDLLALFLSCRHRPTSVPGEQGG